MDAIKVDGFAGFSAYAQINANSETAGVGAGHVSSIETFYRSVANDLESGIEIVSRKTISAGGSTTYNHTVEIPDLSISWLNSTSGSTRIEVELDWALYATGTKWVLEISEVRILKGGSIADTYDNSGSGWTLDSNGVGLQPSAIPLIGCFAQAACSNVYSVLSEPPFAATASTTGQAGWRIYDGSDWITYPVNLETLAGPGISCSVSAIGLPSINCSDSYECITNASQSHSLTGTEAATNFELTGTGSYVWIIPDLERSIKRLETRPNDYRALWIRFALPQSKRVGNSKCNASTNTTEEELFAAESQLLSVVSADPHVIEDYLEPSIFAPYSIWSLHTIGTMSFGSVTGATEHREESYQLGAQSPPSGFIPLYDSTEAITRYVDFCVHPHRHYFLYFEDWDVDSSPVSLQDYWSPIREQWLYDAALPEEEQRRTRNHIIADACEESGGTWFDSNIANGVRPLGLSQWDTQATDPLDSYTYTSASSSLWSASGATLGHGGSITVTPSAAGTVRVTLELGSFTVAPYQWPHIATHLTPSWSGAVILSASFGIIGHDGTEKELGTASGTRTEIGRGTEVKYAGSWAIDNGFSAVTDLGSDADGDGISSATMSDPERAGAFQLLPVHPRKLYFEFEVSGTSTFTLNYPFLEYAPDDIVVIASESFDPSLIYENGQCAALIWQLGPGIRFGNHNHWNPGGGGSLIATPTVEGLGYKSTVLDWLAWKNLWLLGVAYDTNVNSDLAALYDSAEGNSREDATTFTICWLKPIQEMSSIHPVLVNTLGAGVLPIMLAAPLKRDPSTLEFTGSDRAQEVWSWCQEPRRLIEAGDTRAHLFDGSDVQFSDPEDGWPEGWSIAVASPELDNDETGWKIKKGSRHFGTVRPWHGFFSSLIATEANTANGSYDVSADWRHVLAIPQGDGSVNIRLSANVNPLSFDEFPAGGIADAIYAEVRFDRRHKSRRLLMLVIDSGNDIEVFESLDEGRNFTSVATLGSATKGAIVVSRNKLTHYFWLDGDAIKGEIHDSANNVVESTFTAIASGVDDAFVQADERFLGGKKQMLLMYSASGSAVVKYSTDGKTFS